MSDENPFPVLDEDGLDRLMRLQEALQQRLGYHFDWMTTEQKIDYVKMNVLAVTDELHEALGEVTWKPWSHGQPMIHRERYVGELIDALHFLFNLFLVVGVTPSELVTAYQSKNRVNHRRQDEGYDGTKCEGCGRALDDGAHAASPAVGGHDGKHAADRVS